MARFFRKEFTSYDADKNFYDLALIFAQEKLRLAFEKDMFDGVAAPKDIQALDYLVEEFDFAIDVLSNVNVPETDEEDS